MAWPPSWAWVLVGCTSASLAGASGLSDLYPPLWKESPEWGCTELLNKTATYFAKFGPENEQNILWGLPLQHGWQYSSDMNYFLSVLPFLAALDSGIMGTSPDQVTLLPPPRDQTRFCYDVSGCRSSFPETIRKWKMFFQYLQTPLSTFEGLLKYSWNAHTASLKDPIKIFEDRFMYYSKEEENLGVNWAITVNYLAASQFPTTLIRAYTFQKGLPPRILNSTDIAPFISNFTELQNIIVVALNIIGDMNRVTACANHTSRVQPEGEDPLALAMPMAMIGLAPWAPAGPPPPRRVSWLYRYLIRHYKDTEDTRPQY
ncbi:hypothetical protein GW7_05229 [Heterocephalus glaber]|uniref:Protein LEG1 homolog n=1 Tax=Heterocephalus glaber TaxID=10181 RepID=G5C4S1_HETGA|nr:hypothetical protein GW7_05229 [Heterocephalus glaber]